MGWTMIRFMDWLQGKSKQFKTMDFPAEKKGVPVQMFPSSSDSTQCMVFSFPSQYDCGPDGTNLGGTVMFPDSTAHVFPTWDA